ncbi:cytochrome b [Paraburkholderia dipogonis]|uniref:Cytochrome b n=1 Tax=Paraburkholderia dipogonis TaxID=1211383 RepID=A0A4Y8MWW3_9BURK|nr:cytochrome b [Paraburkholderia dipogonis]TFE42017.1 cytochrome b [Paraburkholderia dipogonis]
MKATIHFNLLARALHWLMAALIVAMLFIGVIMTASLSHRASLLNLHRPLGIAIGVLALIRLANRLSHHSPALPSDLSKWQVAAARSSHVVLYVLMLALPAVGWAMLSAGGFPVKLFGNVYLPSVIYASPITYARLHLLHEWLAFVLFSVVVAHLCAALHHAWIRRDGVFASMTGATRAMQGSSKTSTAHSR